MTNCLYLSSVAVLWLFSVSITDGNLNCSCAGIISKYTSTVNVVVWA